VTLVMEISENDGLLVSRSAPPPLVEIARPTPIWIASMVIQSLCPSTVEVPLIWVPLKFSKIMVVTFQG